MHAVNAWDVSFGAVAQFRGENQVGICHLLCWRSLGRRHGGASRGLTSCFDDQNVSVCADGIKEEEMPSRRKPSQCQNGEGVHIELRGSPRPASARSQIGKISQALRAFVAPQNHSFRTIHTVGEVRINLGGSAVGGSSAVVSLAEPQNVGSGVCALAARRLIDEGEMKL